MIKIKNLTGLAFLIMFFSLLINNVNANYILSEDLDYIDGNKEDFYSILKNETNYDLFIANSEVYLSIFINSSFEINEYQFDTLLVNANNSVSVSHKSIMIEKDEYYILEIAIVRSYSSISDNNIIIQFDNLEPFELKYSYSLNPEVPEVPIVPEVTDNDISLSIFEIFGIITIIFIFITLVYRYIKLPIFHVQKEKEYKFEKIGRYTNESELNTELNLYKLYFKVGFSKVITYYSKMSFKELLQFDLQETGSTSLKAVLQFHHIFPHIVIRTQKVPSDISVSELVMNKSKINIFKNILMGILFILQLNQWAINIYESKLSKDKIKLKKIKVLQLEYYMDKIEYLFNVNYEKKDLESEEGAIKWIKKELIDVSYAKILSLDKKDFKNEEYKISFSKTIFTHYNSLKEAIEDKRSYIELQNYFESILLKKSLELTKTKKQNADLFESLRESRENTTIKIFEGIEKAYEKRDILIKKFPELMDSIGYYDTLGMDSKLAFKQGLEDFLNQKKIKETENEEIDNLKKDLEQRNEIIKYVTTNKIDVSELG